MIILIFYDTGIEVTLCLCFHFLTAFITAHGIFLRLGKKYPVVDLAGAKEQLKTSEADAGAVELFAEQLADATRIKELSSELLNRLLIFEIRI